MKTQILVIIIVMLSLFLMKNQIMALMSTYHPIITTNDYNIDKCRFEGMQDGDQFLYCPSQITSLADAFTKEYAPGEYMIVIDREDKQTITHELFHMLVLKASKDCDLKEIYCQEKYAYMMGDLSERLIK